MYASPTSAKLNLRDAKVEGDHKKLKAIQAERAAASP